jgi:hypothetical protein
LKSRLSHYFIAGVIAGAVALPVGARAQNMDSVLGSVITQVVSLFNNGGFNNGQTQANTIVGRTNYGGTVYGDGRIVYNGQTYYTSNNGQTPCSFIASSGPRCASNARGYRMAQNAPRPQWDNTHRNWHQGNGQGNNGQHRGEEQGNNGHNNDHNNGN